MPPINGGRLKITVLLPVYIYYNRYMANKTNNHDFITAGLIQLGSFCKRRKQAVLTGLGVLVVALVVGTAYQAHCQKIEEASWADYYVAQMALLSAGQQEAFNLLDAVNQKYPSSNAGQYAQLLKGDLLYSRENYAQALDVYTALRAQAKNTQVATVADLSLGAAYQATKQYDKSIETMKQFIAKNPTSFALPQAYFTLALSQELAGQKAEALETYKKLLEDYTKSYWGAFAKDKINELKK